MADRRGWLVQPNLGGPCPDRALAQCPGHGDAVVPVEDVVTAVTVVELDRVHPAAGPDLGGYPRKP